MTTTHRSLESSTDEGALLSFILSRSFREERSLTQRYLDILGFLHRQHAARFEEVILGMETYSRVYFARSRVEVSESGRSTQPQPIPSTDLWALTNMRGQQKAQVLERVLAALKYGEAAKRSAIEALGAPSSKSI